MKIGILTFHHAHNYGAVLQAYGLQEFLKSEGHDVHIINYVRVQEKRDNHRDWLSRNPIACVKRLWQFIRYSGIRHKRFDNFKEFVSSRFNLCNPPIGNLDFDVVVVGSDQIWSSWHTGGALDENYFGVGYGNHIISYGASCSVDAISDKDAEDFRKLLPNLSSLSVREEKFKALISGYVDKDIEVVVDPTLLAGAVPFESIASVPREKNYVLIYEIGRHSETFDFAKKISEELNCEIIELTNGMTEKHEPWMRESASPEEFIGYIKHSTAVVTTSFHGTLLSMLFKKPFYTLRQHNPYDIRMENILEKVGLIDRMVEMKDNVVFSNPHYENIESKLDDLVESSKDYLRRSISI